MRVFDRRLVRARRDRRAGDFARHDFLFREVAERLADRLSDVKREFPRALDLGARSGLMASALNGRGGVKTLVQAELSERLARAARKQSLAVVADEEALPFADGSFDLVLSCLSLHWANDLPGALAQIYRALKPDGLFLAALFRLNVALLIILLFTACLASLIVSLIVFIRDINLSLEALKLEIEFSEERTG